MAAIAAAQMMVDYLGEKEAAEIFRFAIKAVLKNHLKSLEAGKMGYGTKEVGDLVVKYIQSME
jgi:3-isopropylmalate dehydrogenase